MTSAKQNDTPNLPVAKEKPVFRRVPLSFVRRGGRITTSQEAAWEKFSNQYLVDVKREILDTSIAKEERRSPEDLFGNSAELIVEIGTGMGEAVVHAANITPNKNFLAVEVYKAGIAKTMMEAANLNLENIRVIDANAPEVLSTLLPAGSVSEVRIFFPDPWHKAKHNKRRLISPHFAALVHTSLAPSGRVRMATDWQSYAEQMRDVFDASSGFSRDFDGNWAERFEGRPITSFESKGIRKGRDIRDLCYTKTA